MRTLSAMLCISGMIGFALYQPGQLRADEEHHPMPSRAFTQSDVSDARLMLRRADACTKEGHYTACLADYVEARSPTEFEMLADWLASVTTLQAGACGPEASRTIAGRQVDDHFAREVSFWICARASRSSEDYFVIYFYRENPTGGRFKIATMAPLG